ncbi:hypothetical protein CDCA_CDCA12G3360 [Cyanidium caldarium]|uniref:Uncharacterized protein n=1 Tax=Cyanidium caldarium TaxID=2771 RepID=A0AAV9IYE0_CYACA|nr:hypothetical protein CDCA_CDCA12G3360 [Cyanidium caldarium]
MAFLKRVEKRRELELLETTPKKHTAISCYRDGALPGRFDLPAVHWTVDAFVYRRSGFRRRGGLIVHPMSVREFEGVEKDAAEAFTRADAEDKYGKFLRFLKLDNPTMSEAKPAFLPEPWPARGTDRSGRLEAFLNDPQCGAWVSDMPRRWWNGRT